MMFTNDRALLTVVVPVLNEQEILERTHGRLTGVLEALQRPYEVIVVDNGSTDQTPAIAAALCARDVRWKYLRLSRNFGYQNSITAGMLAAVGEAIIVIDADLQDPPELIPEFVARWEEGYDVVYGVRQKRTGESAWRILATMTAMRLITWMSDDIKLPAHSGDFRLISRRVRDAFARLPEANRYVRGMIHWLGFRQIGIPYTRRGRFGGQSKADWLYLFGFAANAVFNFSVKPLRLFSFFGLATLSASIVLSAVYVLLRLFTEMPPGLTSVLLLLLINLGVISLGIGILGEYLARVYAEGKGRPLWLVDYSINLDSSALDDPYHRPESPARCPSCGAGYAPTATRMAG